MITQALTMLMNTGTHWVTCPPFREQEESQRWNWRAATVAVVTILATDNSFAILVHQWIQTSLRHLSGRLYEDQVIQILRAQAGGFLA